MKYLILSIIILAISSCTDANWNSVHVKGLPDVDHSFEVIKTTSDGDIFIGGHRTVMRNATREKSDFNLECVLFKSSDFGRSCDLLPLKSDGSIREILISGDTLVVLNSMVVCDSASVLMSVDKGANWRKIYTCVKPVEASHLAALLPEKIFTIIGVRNRYSKLISIDLNGNKVDTVLDLDKSLNIQFGKKHIYTIEESAKGCFFIRYDYTGNSIDTYSLSLNATGGKSYLSTDENYFSWSYYTSSDIVRFSNGILSVISYKTQFPEFHVIDLYANKNKIILIGYDKDDTSILGVYHNCLVSDDNGRSWTKERIADPLITDPGAITGDTLILYGGIGRLQFRK